MRTILLENTKLKVSALCLGTVNYGTALPVQSAKRQLDRFVEAGGNFIDTAHVYGDWEPGIPGRSERVIGEWLRESGMRDRIVLATKGAHPRLNSMDCPRVTPEDIEKDLGGSLSYLCTDHVDLYFLHRDDPSVPVAEIMDCLAQKAAEGKIRYYGCSNWTLKRIREANEYAGKKGIAGFVCNQLMWSLAEINRENMADKTMVPIDMETYRYHVEQKLNAMAYMSIAKGYFTRRRLGGKLPESVEKVYKSPGNDAIYESLAELSAQTGMTFTDLSLLYFSGHPFPVVPIASFDTDEQMAEGMRFCNAEVDPSVIRRLHRSRSLYQGG